QERLLREHIGLCFDVCHQAVEFEDIARSIAAIDRAGIRINKMQISCAIQVEKPSASRAALQALRRYFEPRYLHHTFARLSDGTIVHAEDLTESLLDAPPAGFADADQWRIHFHVPVDAESLGPLGTTKGAVAEAIAAVAPLSYAPHLELETYTWEVLPGAEGINLVDGLCRELRAVHALLA